MGQHILHIRRIGSLPMLARQGGRWVVVASANFALLVSVLPLSPMMRHALEWARHVERN